MQAPAYRTNRVFGFQTDAHLDTLVSEQASFILSRSGVGNLYTHYQENRNQRVSVMATVSAL